MAEKIPELILLAKPQGPCGGVVRAINYVDKVSKENPDETVFVIGQIVHNKRAELKLAENGAISVPHSDVDSIPDGSIVISPAHGLSPELVKLGVSKNFRFTDARCPLVGKVHLELAAARKREEDGIYLCNPSHDEAQAVIGLARYFGMKVIHPDNYLPHINFLPSKTSRLWLFEKEEDLNYISIPDEKNIIGLSQTTLSFYETRTWITAIQEKFPRIRFREDICFATTNRQYAIRKVSEHLLGLENGLSESRTIVFGDQNSHNSKMLAETSRNLGITTHQLDDITQIEPFMYSGRYLAITSGASVSDEVVEEALNYFRNLGVNKINTFELTDILEKEDEMNSKIQKAPVIVYN